MSSAWIRLEICDVPPGMDVGRGRPLGVAAVELCRRPGAVRGPGHRRGKKDPDPFSSIGYAG